MIKKMLITSLILSGGLLIAGNAAIGQVQGQDQMMQQDQTQNTGVNLQLSTSTVRLIKQRLNQFGYDPGNINASWNQQSQQALQNFQSTQGLEPTGQLNYRTMAMLGVNPPSDAYAAQSQIGAGQQYGNQYGSYQQQPYGAGIGQQNQYGYGTGQSSQGYGQYNQGYGQYNQGVGQFGQGYGAGSSRQQQFGISSPQYPSRMQQYPNQQYGAGYGRQGYSTQQQYGVSPRFQSQGMQQTPNQQYGAGYGQKYQYGIQDWQGQGVNQGFQSGQQGYQGSQQGYRTQRQFGVSPQFGQQGGQQQPGQPDFTWTQESTVRGQGLSNSNLNSNSNSNSNSDSNSNQTQ